MLELFPSRAAGPFGRKLKHARGARIPVTIVTGFLGAGKTTLVRRFLESPEGHGTAVVVNEFGAVGIDDALIRASTDEVTLLGQRLPVLHHPLRPADRVAPAGVGARAGYAAAVRPGPDRDQRARRSRAHPADLRDRPGARRGVLRRGGGRGGRCRLRPRHARLVGGSPQAGDPGRPAGDLQDRSRHRGSDRRADRAPRRAQRLRPDRHRHRRRARSAPPDRGRPGRAAAACRASSARAATATASRASC